MATQRKARKKPENVAHDRHFRRRVVVELTADELPLLEAAEARHGSKRGALIAALVAEGRVEELERARADAERAAAAHATSARRDTQASSKAQAKLERELHAARKQLDKQKAELARERARAAGAMSDSDEACRALEEELEAREAEIAELEPYVVDELYCGRCNEWVPPSGWVWRRTEGGGRYAFHKRCGDHGASIVSASSWLAHRRD
jgi:hypothetical protein